MWKENMVKIIVAVVLVVLLVILCVIDYRFIFKKRVAKNKFAKELIAIAQANETPVFRVSKIVKYSSAEAVDNTPEQNLQDVSISQYSDVALYIDNFSEELTEANTVKELYLDNFEIKVDYNYGTPALYYKNPLEISKFRLIENNQIQERLDYEIVYTNEDNRNSDYANPVFFTDCSNPITIGYINKNIVNQYQVTKDNGLVAFDGRIFNNLDMDLAKLSPKISFSIHIKNNLDEEFICNMSANLPLETEEGSVKSGYIIQIADDIRYYNFFKKG